MERKKNQHDFVEILDEIIDPAHERLLLVIYLYCISCWKMAG